MCSMMTAGGESYGPHMLSKLRHLGFNPRDDGGVVCCGWCACG